MEKFKYLGVSVTNTNDIRGEIKHRINMGNACYYSIEKILSSRLLSKKLKVIAVHVCVYVYACVRECVPACVRVCVCVSVCFNANPLHYYALRVPRKVDRWH